MFMLFCSSDTCLCDCASSRNMSLLPALFLAHNNINVIMSLLFGCCMYSPFCNQEITTVLCIRKLGLVQSCYIRCGGPRENGENISSSVVMHLVIGQKSMV